MLNHYRTLLLNIPDQGDPNEFIAPNFLPVVLPSELQNFYDLLFPKNATRYYKQFIAYYCERLLHAANQTQFLKKFDHRISYNLEDIGNYFHINRISNPVASAYNYPILLSGTYTVDPSVGYYFDGYQITQVGYTNNIQVFSVTDNLYVNGTVSSPVATTATQIALTFSGNMSNVFPIGQSGLKASISGNGSQFESTASKQWSFTAEAPFLFDFETFYGNFLNSSVVDNMALYGTSDASSLALWNQHFNTVYKLAGLLNLYVDKVNQVWAT